MCTLWIVFLGKLEHLSPEASLWYFSWVASSPEWLWVGNEQQYLQSTNQKPDGNVKDWSQNVSVSKIYTFLFIIYFLNGAILYFLAMVIFKCNISLSKVERSTRLTLTTATMMEQILNLWLVTLFQCKCNITITSTILITRHLLHVYPSSEREPFLKSRVWGMRVLSVDCKAPGGQICDTGLYLTK